MFFKHVIISGSIASGLVLHAIFIEGAREPMMIASLAFAAVGVAFVIADITVEFKNDKS